MIQDMTDIIIVASLIIAACSLAVNIVAGLGEATISRAADLAAGVCFADLIVADLRRPRSAPGST